MGGLADLLKTMGAGGMKGGGGGGGGTTSRQTRNLSIH